MNSAQYQPYWKAFECEARPVLERLCLEIMRSHPKMWLSAIDVVDHDVERGLGFRVVWPGSSEAALADGYVEFMLADGDESGFDGVGVRLECSPMLSGVVYQPYNYTDQVGTRCLEELRRRIQALPISAVAQRVLCEWREFGMAIQTPATRERPAGDSPQ
jgi:hypothetical protein